jgi:3-mercaptopyruvate sulfurtransferase SseA
MLMSRLSILLPLLSSAVTAAVHNDYRWFQRGTIAPVCTEADARALLIQPDDLVSRLGSERLVVIEVVSPEDEEKAPARIPGSQRVWRPDYQLPTSSVQILDGLAPTPEAFGDFAQRLGVHEDSDVVILSRRYDETRLWWLFIAFGKRSVYVLDGGYDGYMAGAMRPTTLAAPPPRPRGTWQPTPQLDATLLATRADVLRLRGNQEARLWDVRLPGEYDGTLTMKGAARPGRVPWASARARATGTASGGATARGARPTRSAQRRRNCSTRRLTMMRRVCTPFTARAACAPHN